MIKKGLIRTCIYDYIEDNKLTSIEAILNNLLTYYQYKLILPFLLHF